MRLLSILFVGCLVVCCSFSARAQSFSVAYDTVYITPGSDTNIVNNINNLTTAPIDINWKIAATNFPPGWTWTSGICDVRLCYDAGSLWPSGTVISTGSSVAPGSNVYRVILDLSSVPATGIYYLTVRMHNSAVPSDSASQTYITAPVTTAVQTIKGSDQVLLYPNPVQDELNIVYDANADIKNIAVYNIIGKVMAVIS
jgi:hypothetical protein